MITYIDKDHIYINSKGIVIPSVSQLVAFKFNGTYKDVPKYILEAKAEHGTKVHKAIENELKGKRSRLTPMVRDALNEFKIIYRKAFLKEQELEVMVNYKERYAGRVDMVTTDGIVIDYKTTAEIYLEKWCWQLGYYNLALNGKEKYGYIVWLPKGKRGQLIKVEYPTKEELLRNLKEYEKHNTD